MKGRKKLALLLALSMVLTSGFSVRARDGISSPSLDLTDENEVSLSNLNTGGGYS